MVSKGKFGLINENGREIIPAKYEDVGNFPVLRDKKTGALLSKVYFHSFPFFHQTFCGVFLHYVDLHVTFWHNYQSVCYSYLI